MIATCARAIGGALLAGMLDGIARLIAVTILRGPPVGQAGLVDHLARSGLAVAGVLALAQALAVGIGERTGRAAPSAAIAFALTALFVGPGRDLPLSHLPATVVFGVAVALAGRRAGVAGVAGAVALAACHAWYAPGDRAGLLAGGLEGAALGVGLALASRIEPGPLVRGVVRGALAGALVLAAGWLYVGFEVRRRLDALAPVEQEVRAHPRVGEPLFARWLDDVRARERLATKLARYPWRRAEALAILDDAGAILDAMRGKAAGRSAAAHLLGLVRSFQVPAMLEYEDGVNLLTVHRGGVPVFAVSAEAADGYAAEIARGWALSPGVTAFRSGSRRLLLAGGWVHEVRAPTQELRLRVVGRLLAGVPLGRGDDLVSPEVLIPPGILPKALRARFDFAAGRAPLAVARTWLASGLRPFFVDLRPHATESGATGFAHHFAEGQEIALGTAHLFALGATRRIPTPWHTYTARPEEFLAKILAEGALPVLAHALHPHTEWQFDALARWRELDLAGAELTAWMPDGAYEQLVDPPAALAARTMVLARDGSPSAILEAIRAGRCVALQVDQPALSRGMPAMRAALWLLLAEPGRLDSELRETWKGAR